MKCQPAPPGKRWVFRPYFTTKDGQKIWAKSRGKKVFAWLVDDVPVKAKKDPKEGTA